MDGRVNKAVFRSASGRKTESPFLSDWRHLAELLLLQKKQNDKLNRLNVVGVAVFIDVVFIVIVVVMVVVVIVVVVIVIVVVVIVVVFVVIVVVVVVVFVVVVVDFLLLCCLSRN